MSALLAALVLLLVVAVVFNLATWADRLRQRALAADAHAAGRKGAVRGGWADEPENAMHRAPSPPRLAAIRSLLVGAGGASPVVFFSGTAGLTAGHVAWLVVACHAALGVACASFLERRAARRRRPTTGALQAGLMSLAAVTLGAYQCEAAAATLLGGGPEHGLEVHARTLARLTSDPLGFGLGVAGVMLMVAVTWALPVAAITYDQLSPGDAPIFALVSIFSVLLGAPAVLLLSACYAVATRVDRWLGRPSEAPT